jgi:hypothetical protein
MCWAQSFKEILRTYYIFLLQLIFLKFKRGLILTLSIYLSICLSVCLSSYVSMALQPLWVLGAFSVS